MNDALKNAVKVHGNDHVKMYIQKVVLSIVVFTLSFLEKLIREFNFLSSLYPAHKVVSCYQTKFLSCAFFSVCLQNCASVEGELKN